MVVMPATESRTQIWQGRADYGFGMLSRLVI
jgi:hypothetical protein